MMRKIRGFRGKSNGVGKIYRGNENKEGNGVMAKVECEIRNLNNKGAKKQRGMAQSLMLNRVTA
jgi:hypothetical protein